MFGHLVPCSGGKSIVLSRTSVYLGRRADADRAVPLSEQTAVCRLRFSDGWWHAEDLLGRGELRINHERCRSRRLNRLDELTVGRVRFRIDYVPPEDPAVQKKKQDELERIAESVLFSQSNPALLRAAAASLSASASVCAPPPQPTLADATTLLIEPTELSAPSDGTTKSAKLLGRLVPLGGGPDHPLMKPNILIGRQPPCDVVLRVGTISSKHCTLDLIEGYWQVKDLASRNGIRLYNLRCQEGWVFPDSRLSIADQRFRLDYTPAGEPPTVQNSERPSLMAKAGLTGANLEQLLNKQDRQGKGEDSDRKRWELLEDV